MAEMTLGELLARTGGSIKTGPFGTVLKAAEYSAGTGVPVISAGEIRYGRLEIRDNTPRVAEKVLSRLPDYVLQAGDVVFARKGAIDRSAWLKDTEAGYFLGSDGIRVRFGPAVVSRFMAYQFQTDLLRDWLIRHAAGTTMASLNEPVLKQVPMVVPNRSEQQAIAEVLGALDDKVAANDRIARLSLDLARVLFDREVGDVTDRVAIGDLARRGCLRFSDGYRTKRDEHGRPGLRILRVGDVKNDSISPEGADFVSDQFRRAIGAKASQPGDVVLTTKGTVGRVAVIPSDIEQVVYSPQICYFRVTADSDNLNPGFLAAWFRSSDLQRQTQMRMHKSDMAPYINLKDIQSLEVPAVDAMNQERIGAMQSAFERQSHAAIRENRALAHLRDELLPLLMSGRIRVRDAERQAEDVL